MNRAVDIVLDSYGDEKEAAKHMRNCARKLRARRLTARYGVYIEQHRGVWWLILHDRGNR